MSFRKNNIWLPDGSSPLANGEISCDASTKIDLKRGHHFITDASEQALFFNKKQAIKLIEGTAPTVLLNSSSWSDGPDSQHGGRTSEQSNLFAPKPIQSLNISGMNAVSSPSAAVYMEKKDFPNQSVDDFPICLPMSQAVEGSCLNTSIQTINVHELNVSENCFPWFLRNSFYPGDNVVASAFQFTANNMFPGPIYSTADRTTVSADPTFSKIDKNLVALGQGIGTRNGNFMLPNPHYNGIDNDVLFIDQAFKRGNGNTNALGEQHDMDNSNAGSIFLDSGKGHQNFFSMDPFYNKANEAFISTGSTYDKGYTGYAVRGMHDATIVSLGAPYNQDNPSILSMVESSKKGKETTISFGDFPGNLEEKNVAGNFLSSYWASLSQATGQSTEALPWMYPTAQLTVCSTAVTSETDGQINKDQKLKKGSSNFPTNVKSLLSTGVLDGVPVKYVSWSREKNLRGIIQGVGYLCSCKDCKISKVVNAYEFECHAGCKTKHPNNHIYFENGKTIYAVVQELKNTPTDKLFDAIQNATGSPVNQKNFDTWKASFQVATRELHRIYGNEGKEVAIAVPSTPSYQGLITCKPR